MVKSFSRKASIPTLEARTYAIVPSSRSTVASFTQFKDGLMWFIWQSIHQDFGDFLSLAVHWTNEALGVSFLYSFPFLLSFSILFFSCFSKFMPRCYYRARVHDLTSNSYIIQYSLIISLLDRVTLIWLMEFFNIISMTGLHKHTSISV